MNRLDVALAYTRDQDDRLCDAACVAARDCRIGEPAFVERLFPFGVIEAFADMTPVAALVWHPRSGVVLWTIAEANTINGLLDEMKK